MLRRVSPFIIVAMAAGCATAPSDVVSDGPAAPASAPIKQVDLASQIAGADAKKIEALLGEPAFVRREGAREFRRYAYEDCTVFVMMEPDEAGGLIADHVELQSANSDTASVYVKDCAAKAEE